MFGHPDYVAKISLISRHFFSFFEKGVGGGGRGVVLWRVGGGARGIGQKIALCILIE